MYPETMPDIEFDDEYGGGGPEYVVDGLVIPMCDTFGAGMVLCRVGSDLPIRYLSKSKLLIEGKVSL